MEKAAEWVTVGRLMPWARNPRKITKEAVEQVAQSIQRFGFAAPIVARRETGEIIAGHTRLEAAKLLGLESVPVRLLDISEADAHALALADNKLGELVDWSDDVDKLLAEMKLEGVAVEGLGWSEEELAELMQGLEPGNGVDGVDGADGADAGNAFSLKIDPPVYTVKGEKPSVGEMLDTSKSEQLIGEIEAAGLPAEVDRFLRAAAARHNVFDYGKIAEFYAHAPAETQELMERSALVIVDFDKAIEGGFVKLSQRLADIYDVQVASESD